MAKVLLSMLGVRSVFGQVVEPYPWLNGGSFSGPAVPASQDSLVQYVWDPDANYNQMQVFDVAPVGMSAAPSNCVSGLPVFPVMVSCNATIMVDFGVEHAAWLEVNTSATVSSHVSFTAAVSEYNTQSMYGDGPLVEYGAGQYRHETNKQLYNGLRYAFITVACAGTCTPVTITGIKAVAQVLPLSYTGSFSSSDSTIDRIWYTGAYSTRVNLLPGFFGSELLDRGDRSPPFQGDAHVAQSVALTAFAGQYGFDLVLAMSNLTDSVRRSVHDSNIVTYPLQWVLSVAEYYMASGDADSLLYFSSSMSTIIDNCASDFYIWDSPSDMRWSGWDDRVGSGFYDVDLTPEARRYYWMTTMRAAAAFAQAAAKAGGALQPYATKYSALVIKLAAQVRSAGADWYVAGGYGIHALAAAVNGGWTTAAEQTDVFTRYFNDSGNICSWSNFDTGMLISALAVMGHVDYGMAALRQCWGEQLEVGATCWWEASQNYKDMLQGQGAPDVLPGVTTSLCHAWGSLPTTWLTRNVAGLKPLDPGYTTFEAAPVLSLARSGLSKVAATQNTPAGPVSLNARLSREDGSEVVNSTATVTAPAGLKPVFKLQMDIDTDAGAAAALVDAHMTFCNARGALVSRAVDLSSLAVETTAAGRVWVVLPALEDMHGTEGVAHATCMEETAGGRRTVTITSSYSLSASSRDEVPAASVGTGSSSQGFYPPYGPPQWTGEVVGVDNATHGAWALTYGSQGYVLFSYRQSSPGVYSDVASLPPYVSAVAPCSYTVRGLNGPAPVQSAPSSWLQDPSNPSGPVALGYVQGTSQYASWIDVNVTAGAPSFVMSVYVADTGYGVNTSSVAQAMVLKLEDEVTRSSLVPDQLVRHYVPAPAYGGTVPPFNSGGIQGLENGLYVRYKYTGGSMRLRLYCTGGVETCYSPVSAVFFDAA